MHLPSLSAGLLSVSITAYSQIEVSCQTEVSWQTVSHCADAWCCSEENLGMLEGSGLQLLGGMLEECDDIPQQLLDAILVNLLPAKHQENAAAYRCGKWRAVELLPPPRCPAKTQHQKFAG